MFNNMLRLLIMQGSNVGTVVGVGGEGFPHSGECRAVQPRAPNLGAMLFLTIFGPQAYTRQDFHGQILSLRAKRVGVLLPTFAITVRLLMDPYNSYTLRYRRHARRCCVFS
jgi:hypothetical protein